MNKLFGIYITTVGFLLSATIALVGLTNQASAVVDNDPDCNTVAIIRCGVFDTDAMRRKASQDDVPKIYNHLGISQDDLKGQFVNGIVWRDGRVTVDGKVVATEAMTAGRNYGGTPISGTNAGVYSTNKFVTEGQTAFVKMKADGTFDFAVIKSCGNPVKATAKVPEQPKPAYECTTLTVEQITRTKYKFTADAKATNGATIEKYEFGFGDGYGITVTENTYTYDYKRTGTFETNVVVHVKVNGEIKKVTGPRCEKTVTVAPIEVKPEACIYDSTLPKDSPKCVKPVEYCTIPGKTNLPKDSPDCVKTVEYCVIKGKENLPKDSAECKEEVTVPQAIASTGPGALIGGVAGSGALGYGAYAFAQSRRFLIGKHLGK